MLTNARKSQKLKQLCKEEWGKSPLRQRERLINQDDIRVDLVFHMTVQEKAEALQVCQYLLIYFQLVTLAVQKQKFPVCSVVYGQLLLQVTEETKIQRNTDQKHI